MPASCIDRLPGSKLLAASQIACGTGQQQTSGPPEVEMIVGVEVDAPDQLPLGIADALRRRSRRHPPDRTVRRSG